MTIAEQQDRIAEAIDEKFNTENNVLFLGYIRTVSHEYLTPQSRAVFWAEICAQKTLITLELCRRRLLEFSHDHDLGPEETWDDTSRMLFLITYPEFREHFK